MPIFDKLIDAQLRERLSPARFTLLVEELIAYGEEKWPALAPLLASAFNWAQVSTDDVAGELSHLTLTLLLGYDPYRQLVNLGRPVVIEETHEPRPFARRLVRARLVRELAQHQNCSRRDARRAVAALRDDQIDAAVGELPKEGVGDVFAAIVQWLKDHWPQILAALLPLVIALL